VSPSTSKFPDCGQTFCTRHLGATQEFHSRSALSQLLNHMVEVTTEIPDFVIAIRKTYRDIEVAFAHAHNPASQFGHNSLQVITTPCG
jgi:hypothetical protein